MWLAKTSYGMRPYCGISKGEPDQRQVARCLLSHWSKRAPLTRLAAVTSPVGRCGLPLQSCSASGLGTPAPRGCRGSVGPEALESAQKKVPCFEAFLGMLLELLDSSDMPPCNPGQHACGAWQGPYPRWPSLEEPNP